MQAESRPARLPFAENATEHQTEAKPPHREHDREWVRGWWVGGKLKIVRPPAEAKTISNLSVSNLSCGRFPEFRFFHSEKRYYCRGAPRYLSWALEVVISFWGYFSAGVSVKGR